MTTTYRWVCVAITAWLTALAVPSRAQSPGELLEKGIYAEDTEGNLAAAIALYGQVAASSGRDRDIAAQALFRLGACLLKLGRGTDASAAFRKLADQFPEQRSLILRAAALTAPVIQPPPWGEEEVLLMSTARDNSWGLRVQRKDVLDGRPVTRSEVYYRWAYSVVHADLGTLRPLRSEYNNLYGTRRTEAVFSPGSVEVADWENGVATRRRVPLDRDAYEQTTLTQVIRRLPLAERFAATVSVVDLVTGIHDVKISVVGRETLTVRAGTFDAYRVHLAFPDGYRVDYDIWYSADSRRYPLKLSGGLAGEELRSVENDSNERVVRVQDPEMTASLKLPRGWMLTNDRDASEPFARRMLTPRLEAVGGLLRLGANEFTSQKTPEQMATSHLESRDVPRNHKVRHGPESFELNGLPASRLTCDWQEGMIHYWIFITRGEHRFRLWFDARKERWDEFKPVFDEIAASLQLRATQDASE